MLCSSIFSNVSNSTSSFNSYSTFITLRQCIKKVIYIKVEIGALIRCNYTACHLLSIENNKIDMYE